MIKKCSVVLLSIVVSCQNFLWCMNQQRVSQDQATKVVTAFAEEFKKKSLSQNDLELKDQPQSFNKEKYPAGPVIQQQQPSNSQVTQDSTVAARKQDLIQRAVAGLNTNAGATTINIPNQTPVNRRSNDICQFCQSGPNQFCIAIGCIVCGVTIFVILGGFGVFGVSQPKGS